MVPNIRPLDELLAHAEEIFAEVEASRNPVVITRQGHPSAVLQDVASYNELQESLSMLRILLHGREQVKRGETFDAAEAFDSVRGRRTL